MRDGELGRTDHPQRGRVEGRDFSRLTFGAPKLDGSGLERKAETGQPLYQLPSVTAPAD